MLKMYKYPQYLLKKLLFQFFRTSQGTSQRCQSFYKIPTHNNEHEKNIHCFCHSVTEVILTLSSKCVRHRICTSQKSFKIRKKEMTISAFCKHIVDLIIFHIIWIKNLQVTQTAAVCKSITKRHLRCFYGDVVRTLQARITFSQGDRLSQECVSYTHPSVDFAWTGCFCSVVGSGKTVPSESLLGSACGGAVI